MKNLSLGPKKFARMAALPLVTLVAMLSLTAVMAEAPSSIGGVTVFFNVTGGTGPFSSKGYFYGVFQPNGDYVIYGDGTFIANGHGTYANYRRTSPNTAQASYDVSPANIEGTIYLNFVDYKSGTFYNVSTNHPGATQVGTFACYGTRMTAYQTFLYYVSLAQTYAQSAGSDTYLATYYYYYYYSFAAYNYKMWDSGVTEEASSVYTYYKNLASTWLKKYQANSYYNYYSTAAQSYFQNLIVSNAKLAHYYYYHFMSYAVYWYYIREGNTAAANSAYQYYADLAAKYSS